MWSISFVIPGVCHCQVGNRVPIDKHGLPCGRLRFPSPFFPAWGARVNFPRALRENVRRRGTRVFRDKNRAVAIRDNSLLSAAGFLSKEFLTSKIYNFVRRQRGLNKRHLPRDCLILQRRLRDRTFYLVSISRRDRPLPLPTLAWLKSKKR